MHYMFNIKEFQACFNVFCMLLKILFYMGKVRTVWVCIAEIRVQRRVFYPKISHRSCYVQHCTCTQKVAMHCNFNLKEFQACFSTFFLGCRKVYFIWEKCVQCAFKLQRMCDERRVFYPKISQRSCYIQHCTYTKKVAMNSLFNIKEFHASF